MKKIRAGVIGLGVGEQHVLSYQAIENCEVVAVCDLDPAKLKEVADRRNVGRRCADYREILRDPDIDVVSICSYDDHHARQVVEAFREGKHVMVEKPVALTRKEGEAVLRAQQDSGKILTSNLILRQSPRFVKLRERIRAGDFGDVFLIEGDYIHQILHKITEGWRGKMDFYCVTYGGGIHLLDLMRWLVDDEIVEISSMGNKMLTAGTGYKFPDTIASLFKFSRGTLGKSVTTFGPSRTKFHALNVYGTKRTFINDMPNAKIFSSDDPADEVADTNPYPGIAKGDLLPDLVAAIREGREPNVSARDVFRIMDVCFAAWDALNERRSITVSYQI